MSGEPVDSDPKSVARLKDVLPDAPIEVVGLPRGILAPKGIPDSVHAKLNEVFKKATVENPEFIRTQQLMNLPIEYHDPKELQLTLIKAYEDLGKLLKSLGLERK
jgi:tripartite-type tricarboxylate transporter receptor subunit TctC